MTVQSLFSAFTKSLAIGAIAAGSVACGEASEDISGTVQKGAVDRAIVDFYRVRDDGSRGDRVATSETDERGDFFARVPSDERIEIVARGGRYRDEATGNTVDLRDTDELRALLARTDRKRDVVVTPFTDIATDRARARHDRAENDRISDAIRDAHRDVERDFNLTDVDLRRDRPSDLTRNDEPSDYSRRYGAALAGLSQAAMDRSLDPRSVIDLARHIAEDLRDGVIDNLRDGDSLTRDDLPNPSDLRDAHDETVDRWLESDANATDTTRTDLNTEAETDAAESDANTDPADGTNDGNSDTTPNDGAGNTDGR